MSAQLQAQPATAQMSAQTSAQMRAAAAPAAGHEPGDFEPPMPAAVVNLQRRQQQQTARMRLSHGGDPAGPQKVETVRRDAEKVGRNDPCPCGSGKKFKKCHGAQA